MRAVTVTAKNKSIMEICVDAKNLLSQLLKALISHGANFCAQGPHRNMVTRKEFVFAIKPLGLCFFNVPTSRLNDRRQIPIENGFFKSVKRISPSGGSFLRESESYGSMVTLAGVWALTDGYDRLQIENSQIAITSDGRSETSFSNSEIDCAKSSIDRLGIRSNIH